MKKLISELLLVVVLLVILALVGIPKFAAYLHNQGFQAYSLGNYEKSIAYFKQALQLNPKSSITHYSLGNAYMEIGKEDGAIAEYKTAIQCDSEYLPPYRALSQVYADRALFEEALTLLKMVESIPASKEEISFLIKDIKLKYAADCLEKGTRLFLKAEKQDAYRLMDKAVELDPKFTYAYYSIAACHFSERDYSLAENALKTAIGIDNAFWPSYKLLGDVYFEKGNFKEAMNYYKKAVALNAEDCGLFHGLGLALMNLERYDEALPYLKQAVALAPEDKDILYSFASVCRDSGKLREAVQEYNKLIALKPDYPNVHNDLGDIFRNLGNEQEALKEFNKEIAYDQARISQDQSDIFALNDLAYAFAGIKETNKAKEIINKIIATRPNYRRAYITLAKIYEIEGKNEEAIAALNKAKALSAQGNFIDQDIGRLEQGLGRASRKTIIATHTVYLKNGRQIQGRVKQEDGEKVVLEVGLGNTVGDLIFYRNAIERIEKFTSNK
jgi:tetratricopeptide (TPR) repeat protein